MEGHDIAVKVVLEGGVPYHGPGTVAGHDVVSSHVQRRPSVLGRKVFNDHQFHEHPFVNVRLTAGKSLSVFSALKELTSTGHPLPWQILFILQSSY